MAVSVCGYHDVLAHHSGAVFDLETTLELRGVVVEFALRSPHAFFVVDARVFDGEVPRRAVAERWEVEWESAPMLRTLGIEADSFVAGDEITIVATPHRDPGFRFAHAVAVADAFGAEYVMANSNRLFSPSLRQAAAAVGGDPAPDSSRAVDAGISGRARWVGRWQQPLIAFPGGTPNLPLSAAGLAAWQTYLPKDSPANTCEPINVPDLLSAPFFLLDVRLEVGQVVLRHEAYGVVRTVPLGGSPVAADPSGRFGHVSGRVEGDALVVESQGYAPSAWGLGIEEMHGGAVIPSSDRKTLTERFSVTPDGRTLIYTYTLFDPVYMSAQHTGGVELTRVADDVQMFPYECDVESAAMWSRDATDPLLPLDSRR